MKVIIAVAQPFESEDLREGLSKIGAQSVIGNQPHSNLELACTDACAESVISAITHDGRVKAAVIFTSGNPPWIAGLTCRSCL